MVHAEFSEDLHPKMRISRPFVADAHAALRLKALWSGAAATVPEVRWAEITRSVNISAQVTRTAVSTSCFPLVDQWRDWYLKICFHKHSLNGTRAYQTHGFFAKELGIVKHGTPRSGGLKTSLSSFIQSPKLIDELLSDATRSLLMRLSAAPVRSRRRNLRGSPIGALDLEQLGQNCERILQLPSSRPREPFLMDQMEQNQLLMYI